MQPSGLNAAKSLDALPSTTCSFDAESRDDSRRTPPIASPPPPLPERVGRFEIRRKLGQGGFGVVYLAYDPRLDRDVALKVPRLAGQLSREQTLAVLDEARIAARLKHPNVVTIYDADACPNYGFFIAMEFVAGESLAERLKRGKLSSQQTVSLCDQVADALQQGHKLGIVHRDLKPANILLDEAGHAKICDFGLALHEDDQVGHRGDVSGTWRYMSPEQILGDAHLLDGRSDLWSLGAIVYECAAGRPAFRGATADEIREDVLTRDPKPLRQLDDSIPEALDELCSRCLKRDVSNRLRTAQDVRRIVGKLTGPSRSPIRIRAAIAAVAGLLLAAIALVAVWAALNLDFGWKSQSAEASRPATAPSQPATQAASTLDSSNLVTVHSLIHHHSATADGWRVLPGGRGLQAETQSVELLSFGTLTGDEAVDLDLQQVRWAGGIGIFFGHQPAVVNGVPCHAFQSLMIEPDFDGGWRIVRLRFSSPTESPESWITEGQASVSITLRDNERVHVRLVFKAGQWISVAVNGSDQARLLAPIQQDLNTAGQFGLLLNHSGGSVRNLMINGKSLEFIGSSSHPDQP